jgi:hypothetical protein
VRGHGAYGFPKWVTDIDENRTSARVANDGGGTDLALSVAAPTQTRYRSGERVSTLTSYTTVGGAWLATFNQTNQLVSGTTRRPRGLELRIGEGRMADDLRSLKPLRTIRLDVVTEGQAALHLPVPTSVRPRV